jgi:hypothetical protein
VSDHRHGDPDILPYPNRAQRWGSRKLLQRGQATIPGATGGAATLVETPLFAQPQLFYLQVRFAAVVLNTGNTPNPLLPFQSVSSDHIRFTVRRLLDEYAGETTDVYDVNGNTTSVVIPAWFPVGVIGARKLQILAENVDANPGHGTQYVDVVAVPVTSIDQQLLIAERDDPFGQNIFGYSHTNNFRTAASALPVQILGPDASRRQFFITNEGTTRLALSFSGNNPNVGAGAEDWSVILDAKGGAYTRYVSPMDSFWGEVRGVWEGAPGGFAMASAATFIG